MISALVMTKMAMRPNNGVVVVVDNVNVHAAVVVVVVAVAWARMRIVVARTVVALLHVPQSTAVSPVTWMRQRRRKTRELLPGDCYSSYSYEYSHSHYPPEHDPIVPKKHHQRNDSKT